MRFSIKQKQVLGITAMVALVVTALSVLHLASLAHTLIDESRDRAELLANSVYHQAREVITSRDTAYDELRASRSVQAALEAAIYSPDVTDAVIVDLSGTVIASSDPVRVGATLAPRMPLTALLEERDLGQLRAVYQTEQTLEWTQPISLDDEPFGEIRVGLSPLLVRRDLTLSLRPAAVAAAVALGVAVLVAMLLAHVVLRPMHVIRSGLSRLGRGDLGATLDLGDDEFRDLGDVFDQVSAQLRAAGPAGLKPAHLAELSRRIAMVGRLTAGVAHEMKNPLNAMTIHLELLKQKLADDAQGSAHVEVIAHEIRRLDDRIQGFLKFVRPDEASFAPVAVEPLLASVLDAVRPEATRAGVGLHSACVDRALMVMGDAAQLRDAFLNLAQNAIQAMPGGGRLTISCAPVSDRRVRVRVEDTGGGIAPENLAKVFDLYFTTKERGTGIGLSLVYRTVQFHNGTIDVESTVGSGTAFVVVLPAGAAESLQLR